MFRCIQLVNNGHFLDQLKRRRWCCRANNVQSNSIDYSKWTFWIFKFSVQTIHFIRLKKKMDSVYLNAAASVSTVLGHKFWVLKMHLSVHITANLLNCSFYIQNSKLDSCNRKITHVFGSTQLKSNINTYIWQYARKYSRNQWIANGKW